MENYMQNQNFALPSSGVTKIDELYKILRDQFQSMSSNFYGDKAPSERIAHMTYIRKKDGQPRLYYWDGNSERDVSEIIGGIIEARQDASTLKAFLAVAHNVDGTLKSEIPVAGWWTAETEAVTQLTPTSFSVPGDKSHIYEAKRAIRLDQAEDDYGYVAASTYDEATDVTTVTVRDCVVYTDIEGLSYGLAVNTAPLMFSEEDATAALNGVGMAVPSGVAGNYIEDMDSPGASGLYYFDEDTFNTPGNTRKNGTLMVMAGDNGIIVEYAVIVSNGMLAFRTYDGSTWGEWVQATTVEYDAEYKAPFAGEADNAALFAGHSYDEVVCAGGCSWTCSSACIGSCAAGCDGGCTSCTGDCTGTCSSSCTGGCLTGCLNTCKTGCNDGCTSCRSD